MSRRGEFTQTLNSDMKKFLGRDGSKIELRLYPYLHYVMVNDQKIDPNKINKEERNILSMLRNDGHIEGGASGLAMTREFYDYISDIIFKSYVDIEG